MKESKVLKCDVENCAYNLDGICHARSITVGDEQNPKCDTFFNYSEKGGDSPCANVGACKVTSCTFNSSLECQASEINVGLKDDEADCLSYKAR